MNPEPGKHGVVITLDDIYKAGLKTQESVSKLEVSVGKMVAINDRLDSHAADIKEEQTLRRAADDEEAEARAEADKELQIQISANRVMLERASVIGGIMLLVIGGAVTKVLIG